MSTPSLIPQPQNPLMAEIHSHIAAMSPGAQAAIHQGLGPPPTQGVSHPPDGGNVSSISPPIQDPQAHPPVPAMHAAPAQHAPLINPDPQASLRPGGSNPPMPQGMVPSAAQHEVNGPPPLGSIGGQENETQRLLSTGSGISQVHNPFLRGLGEVGNAIGHIAVPGLMKQIPGTEEHHEQLLGQAAGNTKLLQGQRASDTTDTENQAKTGLETAQTGEVPSRIALNQAETEAKLNPPEKQGELKPETVTTPDGKQVLANYNPHTGQYSDLSGNPIQGAQPGKTPAQARPDTPEQQYIDEYQRMHPGASIGEAERKYTLDTQRPPQATIVQVPMIDPSTGRLDVLHKGDVAPQGGMSPTQYGSTSTPTALQKNAGGRADIVLQAIPDVLNDLRSNGAQLGPGMGRFNDIYTGKVGAPNPEFAGLMADLHLLGTAVALAHAQGRMSNELLNEFNSMIASPQQSPKNIEAVLGKVQNFMQRASEQGKSPIQREGGGGGNATQTFHVGSDVYNIPADKVAAFKKEFPNAR